MFNILPNKIYGHASCLSNITVYLKRNLTASARLIQGMQFQNSVKSEEIYFCSTKLPEAFLKTKHFHVGYIRFSQNQGKQQLCWHLCETPCYECQHIYSDSVSMPRLPWTESLSTDKKKAQLLYAAGQQD